MKAFWIRLTVLGALTLMLAPGPAIALCSPGVQGACCCAGNGCPIKTPTLKAPSCCKPAKPAPVPLTQLSDGAAQTSTDDTAVRFDDVAADDTRPVFLFAEARSAFSRPSGTSLYTLHEAFLI